VNQELTLRLVKRFPVLYQDYRSPITQTAMCWGFDHGDGWFEIIWQLSLAIEEERGYSWTKKRWLLFKKSFFHSWNAFVYKLSPVRHDKQIREGSGTHEDPYRWTIIEKAKGDWLARTASKIFAEGESLNPRTWTYRSQSEADWAYAKRALARGDTADQVIQRIADYRADDKADPIYYARLTVIKAQLSLMSPEQATSARQESVERSNRDH
jgi:hypothetical protein